MNSGEPFEIRVKDALEKELASGLLGIMPACAKVFRGKGYFSRDRQNKIKTDVSIEVSRPGQQEPWLVCIWECKNYSDSVPVNDIEEFHAKLEQIGADNTKGTVITSDCFQKGAVEFAKAKRIGLARLSTDESIISLVEVVRPLTQEHLLRGLTAKDTECIESLFYGRAPSGKGFTRLSEYLAEEFCD